MGLSKPAILALMGYVFVAIALFIPVKPADEKKAATYKYNLADRFIVLLIMTIPMALSVYTIHCMVEGSCENWAWINGAMVALWALVIFIVSLVGSIRGATASTPSNAPATTSTAATSSTTPAK